MIAIPVGRFVDAMAQRLPADEPRIEAEARLAGLDPADLLAAYGSPLFVYDLDALAARVRLLRAHLPAAVEVAYAVKANPSLAVLARLAGQGLGADVASAGELLAVTRAGIAHRQVIVTGPGTTDAELGLALRTGVRAVTIESLDELDVLIAMRELARPGQGLLLRFVVPGVDAGSIIGGRGGDKFGLTDDEVDVAIDRLHRAGAIGPTGGPYRLLGFHVFAASNVRDAALLAAGVVALAARAEAVARRHGLAVELLDAGGGLGIPYADDQAPLDLAALGQALERELETWVRRPGLERAQLLLEPGRWLVGPVGAYLTRVVRTKVRDGRHLAIVDGGIHHLARPALIGQSPRVVHVGATDGAASEVRVDVVGPLCTGLDVLATDVPLREPHSGDVLAVLDAGAYGFTESMPLFLSHPQPAEVVVTEGRARLARPRVDVDDLLERQLA